MSLSKRIRFAVLQRDGFRCRYCGATAADDRLEVDHLLAVANGGPNLMANLVTSCFTCNRGKKAYLLPIPEIKRLVTENRPRPTFPDEDTAPSLKFPGWQGLEHISHPLARVYDTIVANRTVI